MTAKSLKIQYRLTSSLTPYGRNARKHPKKQVRQIANSIEKFGFNNPILVTSSGEVIAGHGRLEAAKLLRMEKVPTVCIDHLTDEERRAYILADNKIALNSTYDNQVLALELQDLGNLGFDLGLTGFATAEIDLVIDAAKDADPDRNEPSAADMVPATPAVAVTRRGDMWQLGRHVVLCGDAREPSDHQKVMFHEAADLIFTDPPYNCKINGHVSGLGRVRHDEFAMASGEMPDEEFTGFLETTLTAAAECCKDGAIAFVFMDWRGMANLLAAGKKAFTELKQLCVWAKSNGGMGTFYRSKHELVFAYKIGTAPHTNTFGLGDTGRYRTNVWEYPGISSMTKDRAEEQARHPTPKPVALVADAIRDCTQRGELVLDPFGGSGSTLIAAETCGRTARLIEYEPRYCDVIVRRYEQFTGKSAILMSTRQTFEDVAAERCVAIEDVAA